ncbi:MAG: septum formation initiator family protein [Legionella sp.]
MRMVIICLALVFAGLQYKLWLGEGSILQWIELEKKLAQQKLENKRLLARNNAMQADIVELKSGDQALEELARYELGMVKNNEVYYYFTE